MPKERATIRTKFKLNSAEAFLGYPVRTNKSYSELKAKFEAEQRSSLLEKQFVDYANLRKKGYQPESRGALFDRYQKEMRGGRMTPDQIYGKAVEASNFARTKELLAEKNYKEAYVKQLLEECQYLPIDPQMAIEYLREIGVHHKVNGSTVPKYLLRNLHLRDQILEAAKMELTERRETENIAKAVTIIKEKKTPSPELIAVIEEIETSIQEGENLDQIESVCRIKLHGYKTTDSIRGWLAELENRILQINTELEGLKNHKPLKFALLRFAGRIRF
ncbi:hypothetical protein IPJ91_00200 [bacterium]|nr:MAG: hypothetical protein IPJ91_00200 [bacterium]